MGVVISDIGEAAGVVVDARAKTKSGQPKYASAHDLRRTFGDRWSARVMPPQLMRMMRHAEIQTTLRYYVGRNAEATNLEIRRAYDRYMGTHSEAKAAMGTLLGDQAPEGDPGVDVSRCQIK